MRSKLEKISSVMNSRSESGVTLLETLFAIVILGAALLSLVEALPLAIRMNANARVGVAALSLAQAQAEDLKNTAGAARSVFDPLGNGTQYYKLDGSKSTSSTGATYKITWTVTNGAMTDPSGMPASKIVAIRSLALRSDYGPATDITLTAEIVRPPN